MSGGHVEKPVMQVLNSKQVHASQPNKVRYRLLVSDGTHTVSFAMLTTQVTDENGIPDFTVIRINNYITSMLNNTGRGGEQRVLVILNYDVLLRGDGSVGKIGNPVPLPDALTQDRSGAAQKDAGAATNGTSSGASTPKPTVALSNGTSSNLNQSSLETSLINPISSISPYSNKYEEMSALCVLRFLKVCLV